MSDFKERLINERLELDQKIQKLEDFLGTDKFKEISPLHQGLLTIQHSAMCTYSECLRQRIINLNLQ